jgi:DNA repair exonuclease SbcCD ATPase subunit
MSLVNSIEEFRTMIMRLVEKLEEVNESSRTIPSTEADQLSRKFASLMESLEEVDTQLGTATELLEEIRDRWG